ncbi:MAG TPA: hypothetical protein VF186_07215 [Gaiellaceae bacterium]|jgi:hypothetical protein
MTWPVEPVPPRVEPATPSRRVERARRDPDRERRGGEHGWDTPQDDEPELEDDDGLHVDVLA